MHNFRQAATSLHQSRKVDTKNKYLGFVFSKVDTSGFFHQIVFLKVDTRRVFQSISLSKVDTASGMPLLRRF